ncbi:glycoside hydrolase family 3 C-terminal domain-containing protein [Cellulomonas sp. JH27-2]|uniref:glycoside hydrolase family 3 C-terminal domain-containing protein n=1 Tax=Cellulomonas sp. JH27-2 TaxID=2774139 RepID=UPI00177D91A4|nr:glycoside hydrolase family 3 C-terminal domain-containing protein [Cellulomonas sp. JH27-2]
MTRLTLEQALDLVTGADLSRTREVEGVPSLTMSDGPNGLAMNLPDFSGKVPATCFPSPGALAATWDIDLAEKVGSAIAAEARAAGADVLLAPSVNIRRSPLGGRGFEYYSEDPALSGAVGASFVRGVQSAGVAACVKHYAVNSQETDRMRVSAELDDATLREMYLTAFERIVRDAAPAFVMASYNRVNGTYVSQHRELLTSILRDDWGFDGAVVSDWGAVDDPVAAVLAGLDLEMPGPALGSRAALTEACIDPAVRSAVLQAGERIAAAARRWAGVEPADVDADAHHHLARSVAASSITMLTNDGVLPLADGTTIALIGALAVEPHRQGGGSAGVHARTHDDLVAELTARTTSTVEFAAGYAFDGDDAQHLRDEAVELAARSQVAVVVVGPGEGADTEGRDRETLTLPAAQLTLLETVFATGTPTVVVLNAGAVVLTEPWSHHACAVLAWWLPGEAGAQALADVLTGAVEPAGRLTETIPLRLEDTPTAASFPQPGHAYHAEGLLVGYRWYDHDERPVAFPFGHGLGYTTFMYGEVALLEQSPDEVVVEFSVRNVGARTGSEVWQVYVGPSDPQRHRFRAVRALAAFGKVVLGPGEERVVQAVVPARAFERWDVTRSGWVCDGGAYEIQVGASSRDLRGHVVVQRDARLPEVVLDESSTLREWLTHDRLGPRLLDEAAAADLSGGTTAFLTNPIITLMIGDLPIRRLFGDPSQALSRELLHETSRGLGRRRGPRW